MNTQELIDAYQYGQRNFESAHLKGADLRGADLRGANLINADLRGANLINANLRGADLRGVDLGDADLRDANLRDAILGDAILGDADLRGANLINADLRGANLINANLRGADLKGVDLKGADLRGVENLNPLIAVQTLVCPQKGSFTAFKKLLNNLVAELLIPEDAKRSSATTRKCRASKAIVVKITDSEGKEFSEGVSTFDNAFIYEVGKTVEPTEPFNEDRWSECASGIHFFMTYEEAEAY